MDRFTRLTQEKIASAMSLSYGDQGPLSLAQAVQPQAVAAPAAITVKFVAPVMRPDAGFRAAEASPGTCLIDADGDGAIDYVRLDDSGATLMRNDGRGQFAAGAVLTTGPGRRRSAPRATTTTTRSPMSLIATSSGVTLVHERPAAEPSTPRHR